MLSILMAIIIQLVGATSTATTVVSGPSHGHGVVHVMDTGGPAD